MVWQQERSLQTINWFGCTQVPVIIKFNKGQEDFQNDVKVRSLQILPHLTTSAQAGDNPCPDLIRNSTQLLDARITDVLLVGMAGLPVLKHLNLDLQERLQNECIKLTDDWLAGEKHPSQSSCQLPELPKRRPPPWPLPLGPPLQARTCSPASDRSTKHVLLRHRCTWHPARL